MLENLREQLHQLHMELPKNDLVKWTGGNVSARAAAINNKINNDGIKILFAFSMPPTTPLYITNDPTAILKR